MEFIKIWWGSVRDGYIRIQDRCNILSYCRIVIAVNCPSELSIQSIAQDNCSNDANGSGQIVRCRKQEVKGLDDGFCEFCRAFAIFDHVGHNY